MVVSPRGHWGTGRSAPCPLEPPLLILLRDHFVPVTVTTMLAVTIFYWFFGFAIRGSFQTKPHGEQASGESTAPEITS